MRRRLATVCGVIGVLVMAGGVPERALPRVQVREADGEGRQRSGFFAGSYRGEEMDVVGLSADAFDIDEKRVSFAVGYRAPAGTRDIEVDLPGCGESAVRKFLVGLIEREFACRLEVNPVKDVRLRLVVVDAAKLVPSVQRGARISTSARAMVFGKNDEVAVRWDYSCEGCTLRQVHLPSGRSGVEHEIVAPMTSPNEVYDFRFMDLTEEEIRAEFRDTYGIEFREEEYDTIDVIVHPVIAESS